MDKIKLSIEAIRVNMNITKEKMASVIGCSGDRYTRLANRSARMYADELIRLSEASGVPYANIDTTCKQTEG